MKKICMLMALAVVLCGCCAEPTWETVQDIIPEEVAPVAQQLYVPLPDDAAQLTFQEEASGELYL